MQAAYADAAARLGDLPPMTADYAAEIATCQVWLADIGGKIAGGVILEPKGDGLQLANVAVDPAHAGKGIGTALIGHAEAEAARQGFSEIRLSTHRAMPENQALYLRLGWQDEAADGDTLFMKKRVDS